MLASPATGPVENVWFSASGTRLYARARSGKTFQTDDFETWSAASTSTAALPMVPALAVRAPEAGSRIVSSLMNPTRLYALGRNLLRSDDGGRSWTNLTAFQSQSVIGAGQHALAVSPSDADQLVVANDSGVWRSMDGGMSWAGLNQVLPNLPVRRILATPATAGARIWADGIGGLELAHGATEWQMGAAPEMDAEAQSRRQISSVTGADITAAASAGTTVYAGSADGRLWVSTDGGVTFVAAARESSGAVERIFVDAAEPRVALAVTAGPGARVLRTTNTGGFWDDLSAGLPDGAVHGVTADRAANAVYVATDRGVYYGRADLSNASAPSVTWTLLTGSLEEAAAMDVRLDAAGNQLYVALDGQGVLAARAPHRQSAPRVVNAADFSLRAAAPGSLLSVVGARISGARAGSLNFPVLAASDTDSQIQVPFEVSGTSLALALETRTGSVSVPLALQTVSPAIFVGRDGAPMLFDADSELLLDGRTPARSNMRVKIFATGLGRVRPDWPTGLAAPLENVPAVIAGVRAYLDRVPVTVTRATLAPGYIGFYVIEVQLPAVVNAGQAELYLSVDGQESNRVQITIEP